MLWIVPLLSAKSQRFGDMVAGTIVVEDATHPLAGVRERLSRRAAVEDRFHFDGGLLKKLRPQDVNGIEQLLERWNDVPNEIGRASCRERVYGLV